MALREWRVVSPCPPQVGPECSCDFERAAPVKDKTLKLWEGALHTLVCELPETRDQVLRDVREWILKRAA